MPDIFIFMWGALFIAAGTLHFINTNLYISIMPSWIPWHKTLVLISGVLEILAGCGLFFPSTRNYACYGLIALLIAIFPANINMAINSSKFSKIPAFLLWLRLPVQLLFIAFTWACRN